MVPKHGTLRPSPCHIDGAFKPILAGLRRMGLFPGLAPLCHFTAYERLFPVPVSDHAGFSAITPIWAENYPVVQQG